MGLLASTAALAHVGDIRRPCRHQPRSIDRRSPDSLATLIFTRHGSVHAHTCTCTLVMRAHTHSGSTGRPKGAMITSGAWNLRNNKRPQKGGEPLVGLRARGAARLLCGG